MFWFRMMKTHKSQTQKKRFFYRNEKIEKISNKFFCHKNKFSFWIWIKMVDWIYVSFLFFHFSVHFILILSFILPIVQLSWVQVCVRACEYVCESIGAHKTIISNWQKIPIFFPPFSFFYWWKQMWFSFLVIYRWENTTVKLIYSGILSGVFNAIIVPRNENVS